MDDLGKLSQSTDNVADNTFVRLRILSYLVFLLFLILISRVWYLQMIKGDEYRDMANNNSIRNLQVEAPRGFIYDRGGQILVKNRPSPTATMRPEAIKNDPMIVAKLSKVLTMSTADIMVRLNNKKYDPLKPRPIKEDLNLREIAYLNEHQSELKGVNLEVRSVREYPFKDMAAHVLGYVGEVSDTELKKMSEESYTAGDTIGKTNLERSYEPYLKGLKGSQIVEVNAVGKQIRRLSRNEAIPGNSVVITIDTKIQQAAEKALVNSIGRAHRQKFPRANAGAIVVMDPNNGDVLALASYPKYDPSTFINGISTEEWKTLNSKESGYPLIDRAVDASYPPGSTLKPIVAYGALKEGIVTANTSFYCGGRWTGFGKKWGKYCWRRSGHGPENLGSALAESCDIYFYNVGYKFQQQKKERLQYWSKQFGYGEITGIDLVSESRGRVPDAAWKREFNKKRDPKNVSWLPGDTVNLSIGQGDFLATPLQLAYSYQAFANGGKLYKPRLVSKILDPQLKTMKTVAPVVSGEFDDRSYINQVRSGLRRVVTEGTAKGAFAGFNVPVAGKTGTAQVFGKDDYALFVGMAPYDDPKYVIAVIVEQGGHGASVAAPAVREILGSIYGLKDKVRDVSDSSR